MAPKLPPPGDEHALYLFDLSGYVFRAYHAVAPLNSSSGEPTAAVMGTVNMLEKVFRERKPAFVAVAMDSRTPTFRKQIDERYKAHRPPAPPELVSQMRRCEEVVRAYSIPVFQKDGFEADDLIATAVKKAREDSLTTVIVSADKDLMQLVDDERADVLLWDTMRDRVFGPAEVREKFGVPPSRVRDFLALTGDSSDNVPGVPSVGPKTATDLLTRFTSLDDVYQHLDKIERVKLREALANNEKDARLSQELVTLKSDVPLDWDLGRLRYGGPNNDELRRLFAELEFTRLLTQLDARPTQATVARKNSIVSSVAELQAIATRAQATRTLSLVLLTMPTETSVHGLVPIGASISVEPAVGAYVPIGHRYLGAPAQITWSEVLSALKPVLESESIAKVFHDWKNLAPLFRGVAVKGTITDVMLASQTLDPDADASVEGIAKKHLRVDLSLDSVAKNPSSTGKKSKPTPIDAELVEVIGGRFASYADATLSASRELMRELDKAKSTSLFRDVEMPLTTVLTEMEELGMLVDETVLTGLGQVVATALLDLEKRAHASVGRAFSLRSRDQLEEILFDEMKLPVLKKTAKGGRSTDAEVLEELALEHELPALLLEYRELDKLKGTYIDALPRSILPSTGRIHTRFHQIGAATGRIASNEPNLQNIPIRTELGRKIRAAFIAPKGMSIISADYSQIELRVLAHLAEDPELVKAFTSGDDIHTHTASLVFGVEKSAVTQEMRRRAKTINFGVIYGMGDVALAKGLDISRAEAQEFIRSYFERYVGVRHFMDATLERARAEGSVATIFGRRRLLPNLRAANRMLRMEAERIAKNTPIQGTAADILKIAMVKLHDAKLPASARMVLTVHDELVFEVKTEEAEEASRQIKKVMEEAVTLRVPLEVNAHHAANWNEAH